MWKKAVLIAAASAVVVLIASAFLFGPKDEQLILEALDNSIKASRTGQPGGVAEYLSKSLVVDGEATGAFDISKVVRLVKPDVEVLNRDVQIQGGFATIESPVNIRIQNGDDVGTTKINHVTITFAKESGVRWGIIPYPKWRIRDIKTEGFDPGILMPGIP